MNRTPSGTWSAESSVAVPFFWWLGDPLTKARLAWELGRLSGTSRYCRSTTPVSNQASYSPEN